MVGSHEGWGSGSMKGDGKGRGSLGGWEGECHQRVVRGGAIAPNGTVSPSKAVGTDCSGQSTVESEGSGFEAQRYFLAVCLRASVFPLRASLSSSVEWA